MLTTEKNEPGWLPFIVAALLALVAWVIYLVFLPGFFPDWTTRGQFGDMFGALNALFSAIAFAALAYTMILQKAELRLQRLELQETRAEIHGQRIQLEEQTKTFILQSFESTFFHLVDLHHQIIDGTKRKSLDVETTGRERFSHISAEFVGQCIGDLFTKSRASDAEMAGKNTRERIDFMISRLGGHYKELVAPTWEKVYASFRTDLAHYFRNLYHIVKFVDSQIALSQEKKQQYVSMLRAQLSAGELALLFQNGISARGVKFKPLIEKYSLLKNLDEDQFVCAAAKGSYSSSAYGK